MIPKSGHRFSDKIMRPRETLPAEAILLATGTSGIPLTPAGRGAARDFLHRDIALDWSKARLGL
jgi:hypothetical protein